MTVSTNNRRFVSPGNGATLVFAGPRIFTASQLSVYLVDDATTAATLLTNGVDYTVSGLRDEECTITMAVAPAVGKTLLRLRTVPFSQVIRFQNQGAFLPELHENMADLLAMQIQQLSDKQNLSFYLPETTVGFSGELPAPISNYVLVINSTNNGVTLVPPSMLAALGADFLQLGTGAELRSVVEKLRDTVSVKDFGALGDGVTDDTAAFAAALATGKRVFVPSAGAASYRVDNLAIPTGAVLYGEGSGSRISPFTVGAGDVLTLSNGAIDIEIYGLTFLVDPATYPAKEVIGGGNNARVTLRDLHFVGGGAYAINIATQSQTIIQRVRVDGAGQSGILLFTAVQCQISDCVVKMETGILAGIEIYNGTLCKISGCNVERAGVFGLHFVNCSFCTMVDNTTWNTDREGINLQDSSNCLVANNLVSWDGATSIDFGISVYAQAASASYNSITGNAILRPFKSGICIDGSLFNAVGTHIAGNRVYGCNIENDANGAGVLLFGANVVNTDISDNLFDGTIGSLKYGVNAGGASTLSSIKNNRVINAATAAVDQDNGTVALNGAGSLPWVPTVVPGSGAFTALGAVSCSYYELEKMVFFRASVTITTNGTAATTVIVTLPFAASGAHVLAGRESAVTGLMVQGSIVSGSSNLVITKYDATYPGGNGHTLVVSGWYQRA